MKTNPFITLPLWGLVIFGFLSALQVSFQNMTGVACPNLLSVPVCYVVTVAYALMLGSLMVRNNVHQHHLFCAGWVTAFVIALFASAAELIGSGGICPSTSSGGLRAGSSAGVPLCYLSLALLVAILFLFIIGSYRKACEADKT